MKKIHNELKRLLTHGYYYRLIVTPFLIELKLYKEPKGEESNYAVDNDSDGKKSLYYSLQRIES